jgi:hypothetical protein
MFFSSSHLTVDPDFPEGPKMGKKTSRKKKDKTRFWVVGQFVFVPSLRGGQFSTEEAIRTVEKLQFFGS